MSSTDSLNSLSALDSISFSWWQILIIAIPIVIIICVVYALMKKKGKEIENNNEYGSSRFATEKELHKDFDREDLNHIKEFGFPIWFDKNLNYMLVDRQTPHWLFLGSTGSGKSLTSVKPQSAMIATAEKKRSVFFSDPKGELFNDTAKMFLDNGYEVLTLDFRNPTRSNKLNILEPVIVEWERYFTKKQEWEALEANREIAKIKYDACELALQQIKNPEERAYYEHEKERQYNQVADIQGKISQLQNESMDAYGEACRLVGTIADMITSEENTKDPFFNASAGNLLAGLIFFFLERYEAGEITRDKITLNSISKFQTSTTEESNAKKFKKIMEDTPYSFNSKLRLTNVIGASENTYKSITAVFGQKMSIFNDLNVANVTSSSDFSFDALGRGILTNKQKEATKIFAELQRDGKVNDSTDEEKINSLIEKTLNDRGLNREGDFVKPCALYVIVRDEDESYNILITLIVGLMYKCLVKLAVNSPKQRLPIDIVFMLDEFANCPAFPSIGAMVTVARSRGMMFQFYIQEFSQLDKVYGKEVANIIKGNAGLVYLKTTSYDTAEIISKRLGKKTIQASSFSHGMGFKETFSGNTNTSLMGRELFTPDEIMQLEYKTIIFPIKKSFPIYRDTVPFFSFFKTNKKFYEGTISRRQYVLSQLDDKKYTIEEVPDTAGTEKVSKKAMRQVRNSVARQESDDKMYNQDYNLLRPAIAKVKEILKTNYLKEEIKENADAGRYYAEILTNSVVSKDVSDSLQKINKNQSKVAYHIENNDKDNYSIITIYIANITEAASEFISFEETNNIKRTPTTATES